MFDDPRVCRFCVRTAVAIHSRSYPVYLTSFLMLGMLMTWQRLACFAADVDFVK